MVWDWLEGDGPPPYEAEIAGDIDRYGVEAVLGRRVLGFGEIRRMNYVRNLASWHGMKTHSKDWAKFAADNPHVNRALNEAMIAAGEDGE